ncbi:hypothetical protein [Brevibacillus brevis]|uniref:hypothetical protein n=1 Tax=Brevibacillus brevis TaxID=1393 RepID=UPI00165D6AF7|nr:hypothetical protein [Brevibacillus brevis]
MAVLNFIGGCERRANHSIDRILETIKGIKTEIETLKSFDLPEDYVSYLCQYSRATLLRDLKFSSSRFTILSPHNVIDYWKGFGIDHFNNVLGK